MFASMTIDTANRLLIASLTGLYDEREASGICSLVMEQLTALPKSLRLLHKSDQLTPGQEILFNRYKEELLKLRPVQYVLGEAWFGNLPFYVNEQVLIPRPETEELADWLLKDESSARRGLTVLDIGTGSGCIAVYLKKKRLDFRVMALDISEPALEIAKRNGDKHHTEIEFILCDIRDSEVWAKLPDTDLMISNPPYIPEKQKNSLDRHVRDFEPAIALFAPDEDPIFFYKLIGKFATVKLKSGGALFLEIHHDYAKEIMDWYIKNDFLLELRKDFSGNNRMIKAWRT
jgi:release factor glutamine methyltransferase